jgi:hypothetical protein
MLATPKMIFLLIEKLHGQSIKNLRNSFFYVVKKPPVTVQAV